MTPRSRSLSIAAALLAAGGIVAGCGSGSSTTAPPAPSSAATPSASAAVTSTTTVTSASSGGAGVHLTLTGMIEATVDGGQTAGFCGRSSNSSAWTAGWTSTVSGAPYSFLISIDSGYTGPGTYHKGQFRFTLGPESTATDSAGQTFTQGNAEYSVLSGTLTTDAGDASGTLDVGMEHGVLGDTPEVLHVSGRWTCQFP